MPHAMLTGATGFIGRHLADHLLDEGYSLSLLVRTPSKARDLEQRGATLVEGDLDDTDAIARATEKADVVFHLAALYRLGADLETMRRVNVEGTRNVLDAAEDAGVDRIVYCGSDTSLGDTRGKICDESKSHDGDFRSNYEQSKYEAHRLVEDRIDDGLPVINAIVSTVYGPGDTSPVAELIAHHLAGRAIAHVDPDTGYTFAYVEDVATALRLACEKGEVGERYLIGDQPATFQEFFEALSEKTGIAPPRFEIPDWLVDAAAPAAERLGFAAGKSPEEIREMLLMGRDVTRFYSGEKAQRELGWNPGGLEAGLEKTVPSFERQEAESAEELLRSAKIPLVGLTLFDIGLGMSAVVFPQMYMKLMHPHGDGLHTPATRGFLARTGLLWLFFAFVQGTASVDPVGRPGWVMVAGALRLMDVPADIGYLLKSDDQGLLGKAGLVAAPLFNLGVGAFLVYAGYRGLRSRFR